MKPKRFNDLFKTERQVIICRGTGCESQQAEKIYLNFKEEIKKYGLEDKIEVKFSGCRGFCQQGPSVTIEPAGIMYCLVKPEDVSEIAETDLKNGGLVERLLYIDPKTKKPVAKYEDMRFFNRQTRIALRNCGYINPEAIDDYLALDGYDGIKKALTLSQMDVINEVKKSGLRGRGGGGFPTGLKWEFCNKAPGDQKYLICNADEGDPGAFMDRSVLEGDPHTLLEGMMIAAYAIGATKAYIYVRAEYPLACERIKIAISQARERGFLGKKIFGSDLDFDVKVKLGASAFVCGEETALMASIEGRRGMPVPRPPFPAIKGLFGKPTNINNVETLANLPPILTKGGDWFASVGTEKSKGTKVFALTGKIANSGLVEIPMGIPLREVIEEIGGGIPKKRKYKAAQTGGPSGGCIPIEHIDIPIDFEHLSEVGSIMGSGGLVVTDEQTCIVDLAKFFLSFTQRESCGKCIPCRLGTKQILKILKRITEGEGKPEDLDRLEELARIIKDSSLCGLGQTAPNPILTTLRYFRSEYEAHIKDKICPAHTCVNLVKFEVDPEKCSMCGQCFKACPANAVTWKKKQPASINKAICVKCMSCIAACRFDAIY